MLASVGRTSLFRINNIWWLFVLIGFISFVEVEQGRAQDTLPFTVEFGHVSGFVQARMGHPRLQEVPFHGSLLLTTDITLRSRLLDASYIRSGVISEITSISSPIGSEANRYLYLRPSLGYLDTITFFGGPLEIAAQIGDIGDVSIGSGLLIKEQPSLGWKSSIAFSNILKVSGLQCGQSQLVENDDYRVYGWELYSIIKGTYLSYLMSYSLDVHESATVGCYPRRMDFGSVQVYGSAEVAHSWSEYRSGLRRKDYKGTAGTVELGIQYNLGANDVDPVVVHFSRDKNRSESHLSLHGTVNAYDRTFLGPFQDLLRADIEHEEMFPSGFPYIDYLARRYHSLTAIHASFFNPILFLQHSLDGAIGISISGSIRIRLFEKIAVTAQYAFIELRSLQGGRLFEGYSIRYDEQLEQYVGVPEYTNRMEWNYYAYSIQWQASEHAMVSLSVQNNYLSRNESDAPFTITEPYVQARYSLFY